MEGLPAIFGCSVGSLRCTVGLSEPEIRQAVSLTKSPEYLANVLTYNDPEGWPFRRAAASRSQPDTCRGSWRTRRLSWQQRQPSCLDSWIGPLCTQSWLPPAVPERAGTSPGSSRERPDRLSTSVLEG